jgi:hypothetical protein
MNIKFYLKMPLELKYYYLNEMEAFRNSINRQELQISWRHLERAHILGQSYPIEHTIVHFQMLKFGLGIKNWKEVIGQIPRLLAGGVKSFIGKIPIGNPGGANVHPLQPMEIPEDLKKILDHYKK